MNNKLISLILALLFCFGFVPSAIAAGDLTKQTPIEVKVMLGDTKGALRFYPAQLTFETGKLYKLVLHNASSMKHYFSSASLARSVFTRKAQVLGADGKSIAEIKGTIREIEVYPGGTAEWWFVPLQTANLKDLRCTIKGHTEAGMVGSVTIK